KYQYAMSKRYAHSSDVFALLMQPDHPDIFHWGKHFDQQFTPVYGVAGMQRAHKAFSSMHNYHFMTSPYGAFTVTEDCKSLQLRFEDACKVMKSLHIEADMIDECRALLNLLNSRPSTTLMMIDPNNLTIE